MPHKKKPGSIKVMGWLFLFISIWAIVAAAGSMIVKRRISNLPAVTFQDPCTGEVRTRKPDEGKGRWAHEEFWGPAAPIFRYLGNIYVHMALSIMLFVSSIFFMRCKEWARKVLIGYSLLGLLWILPFGAMFTYRVMSDMPAVEGPMANVRYVLIAWSVLISLLYAGIAVVFIFVLRGKKLRAAMK